MTKVNYNKYTDERFATAEDFQKFLQSGKTLKYDYVIVGDILYTMEEYDLDGKMVVWANRKHNKNMSVMTSDRYKNGYLDAEVAIFDAYGYRTDITYAE